jgi:hypothetical protein
MSAWLPLLGGGFALETDTHAHCDMGHFQEKSSLIQLNHRSDELSRGSARGLGRGWWPSHRFPSLEAGSQECPNQKFWKNQIAAVGRLAVYLNPTIPVVFLRFAAATDGIGEFGR